MSADNLMKPTVAYEADAAKRLVRISYTPPLALEPVRVIASFAHIKSLAAQIIMQECHAANAAFRQLGREVPAGVGAKHLLAEHLMREAENEFAGRQPVGSEARPDAGPDAAPIVQTDGPLPAPPTTPPPPRRGGGAGFDY